MGECSFAGLCFYVYQSHHLGIEATIKLHFRGGSGLLVANSFPVNWPWYRLGLTYFDRSLIRILMGGGEKRPPVTFLHPCLKTVLVIVMEFGDFLTIH